MSETLTRAENLVDIPSDESAVQTEAIIHTAGGQYLRT